MAELTITVPVAFAEAALGADIEVPTLDDGPVKIRIPAGTKSGRVFRVGDRGVTRGSRTGSLLVTVEVAVPAKARIAELEADLAEARRAVGEAVESTHRQYRRDLVPLRQEVTVFGRWDLPKRG